MSEILDDLAVQHAELWSILEPMTEAEWRAETPCEGWTAADVVLHLRQTDELALASLRGELASSIEDFIGAGGDDGVDAAAAAAVAGARGTTGEETGRAWWATTARLRAELARVDPSARLRWVAGDLSARTLAATRLAECWIHTGDVAAAIGVSLAPTNRLRHVARLAWRTLPYAFARAGEELHGSVAFDLVGPDGERWEFGLADEPATIVTGSGAALCQIAGRRLDPTAAPVVATGVDAEPVLRLVRTYA